MPSRTVEQLAKSLDKVITVYRRGGFIVRHVLMDMEFEPLVDQVDAVIVNTTAAREHVGDIERQIRVIKDRAHAVTSELPYKNCMPDAFIIRLVYFCVFWLNAFVNDNGVSDVYLPRKLVTGLKVDYAKHCRARWGAYVEASDDLEITNTQRDRTSPCIMLGPTGNSQGSVWCFNLETKAVVKRRTITLLPMPDRVVRRVVALGKRARQTRSTRDRLNFLNRHKAQFAWDTTDFGEDQDLVELPPPHETDNMIAEIPGVLLESDYDTDEVIETPPPPDTAQLAAAALQNANLASNASNQIAGVDITPTGDDNAVVSDDEAVVSDDEADGEDPEDPDDGPTDDEEDGVVYIGENIAPPSPHSVLNVASEEDEFNDEAPSVDDTDYAVAHCR